MRGILYNCKCIYSMHTCVYLLQRYDEELVVPIIENTPEEMDLAVSLTHHMSYFPTKNSFQDLPRFVPYSCVISVPFFLEHY